jgi:hypothetical protein
MGINNDQNNKNDNSETGHEIGDINFFAIIKYGIGLIIIAIVIQIGAGLLFKLLDLRADQINAMKSHYQFSNQRPIEPPPPRLQSNPFYDLSMFRDYEDRVLSGEVVDPVTGAKRMPIEQAIDMLVKQSPPASSIDNFKKNEGLAMPSGASSGRKFEKRLK